MSPAAAQKNRSASPLRPCYPSGEDGIRLNHRESKWQPMSPTILLDPVIARHDPEIAAAIEAELGRQRDGLELIASENIVSRAVLEALAPR